MKIRARKQRGDTVLKAGAQMELDSLDLNPADSRSASENGTERARSVAEGLQPFPARRAKPWQGYLFATLSTLSTLGVRLALEGQLKDRPTLIVFALPIMLSAYVGGVGAGLLATAISVFGSSYFLLPPIHTFRVDAAVDCWDLFFLLLAGVVISVLNEALHRARRKAAIAAHAVCRVERDITERKRAADALQQSEAQLQTIIENISEAVVVSDLNGQLLHFNHAALKMMGYSSLDEGRRALNDLADTFELSGIDGVVWSVDQWPMSRILRGEKLHNLEARMRRIGTDWEHVYSFGGTIAHDAAGNPLMAVVTFSEITERHRAEAAAILLAAIVSSSSDAIIGKDLNGIVTSWNGAAESIFGYSADEMLGQSISIVIPPDRQLDEARIQERVKAGERVEHFETHRIRKDGERIIVSVTVSPIRDAAGQVIGSSKSVRDITAIKQAAGEIRQLNLDLEQRVVERTAQLSTANRELEAFSYSVSHDLRAPLRSIDGFSKAILEDYGDKLDSAGQDCLHRVRAASQRMGQLIDDLLNLSRVSRGELRHEPTDFSQIAREVFEECRSNAEGRDVSMKVAADLVAHADPRLMRIVLTNLISNAWKFTGNRQHATIEFGCNVLEGRKEYFVRDNGAGFDMTYVGKLFGAFQRLHSDHEFAGTGIGLATIKRIIQRHGGTVRAEGKPGEGATFYFTLDDPVGVQTQAFNAAA